MSGVETLAMGESPCWHGNRLSMVRVDKDYVFESSHGPATLLDLFERRQQLIVCPSPDSTPAAPAGRRRLLGASRALASPSRTRKPPAKAEARAHADMEQLRVCASQLPPGDLVTGEQSEVWEVSCLSSVYQAARCTA
jgi:hypothetical protein